MNESITTLLVEDNAADARLLREVLAEVKQPRIEVAHVVRLADALERLSHGGVDVVLLDLSLPDASGRDTILRAARAAPSVPIVVLTGLDDDEVALDAVKAGAQDYLVKGRADAPLIARALRYAIERKRADEDRRHLAQEQAARRLAEAAEARSRFLAEVSDVLASSLDYRATLQQAARLLADVLADGCAIDVLEDGELRRVAEVRATGEGDEALLQVPLTAHGRDVGLVTFARRPMSRGWPPEDVRVAGDFARRAALAVENARLYRARDDMLGIVSHDLRNPLNVIGLALSLLDCGDVPPELAARQRAAIRRALGQMKGLISDLLDVTRLDADALPMTRTTLQANEVVADACDALRALAEDGGVTLAHSVAPDLPPFLADRDRILQVLSNLAGNAIKFSPHGRAVTIAATREDGGLRIAVRDEGPGIPPEELPHVFDRFFQGTRDRRQGAGLGLAIAKRIVIAHGGRIGADSRLGAGSTFWFTLPAQRDDLSRAATRPLFHGAN
jgi:signal transduction histidine kinase